MRSCRNARINRDIFIKITCSRTKLFCKTNFTENFCNHRIFRKRTKVFKCNLIRHLSLVCVFSYDFIFLNDKARDQTAGKLAVHKHIHNNLTTDIARKTDSLHIWGKIKLVVQMLLSKVHQTPDTVYNVRFNNIPVVIAVNIYLSANCICSVCRKAISYHFISTKKQNRSQCKTGFIALCIFCVHTKIL